MLAIRLPAEIEARLNELAHRTGRSKSFYVRQAIVEHLDDLEDLHLAEQRLIESRARGDDAVSLDSLMKRYGLAD
jgi:RHH-type transcriptional regulator, rel operon repressor / antitoxin RelB